MKVTAVTKFKHGGLFAALQKLGWTQAELGRRCKVHQGTIGDIINLHRRPNEDLANTIQRVLAEAGHYIDVTEEWPETFKGFGKTLTVSDTREVSAEMLEYHGSLSLMANIPDQSHSIDMDLLSKELDAQLDALDNRGADILRRRFLKGETLEQVADAYGRCPQRIRQIEAQALRMLRHPKRIIKLEDVAEECGVMRAEESNQSARDKYKTDRGVIFRVVGRQLIPFGSKLECCECGKWDKFGPESEAFFAREERYIYMHSSITCHSCLLKSPSRISLMIADTEEVAYVSPEDQDFFLRSNPTTDHEQRS